VAEQGSAQVRWLVAGSFGLGARGKTISLTRADFNEVLEKQKIQVDATIADEIGAGGTRTVPLVIDSLKVLSLKHIVGAVPELAQLAAKADEVGKLKDPAVADLERVLGKGKLAEKLSAMLSPQPDAPKSDEKVTGDADKIFEKAAVPEKTAKSAIDMFVRSTQSSPRTTKGKPAARQLRDLVEQAAYGAAASVLRSPEVEAVEAAWRGLRFLVSECPKDAQMKVTILETDAAHVLQDLADRERGEDLDEADCIFVAHDFDSTAPLAELADFAEQELIPIAVGVKPSLFGCETADAVPSAFEQLERAKNEEVPAWATSWDELRMRESTRWLCAVVNRVVLHEEGAGEAKRTAFGSGVWGLAPLIAASYRATGGFARILGKAGSLRGPATHTIARGSDKDTAAPTEAFYAIASCELLAKNGLLGVGSARNSDAITLLKAPMVRGAKDAVPLPSQILTGRVVRFAGWIKPQLPEGCDSETANDIFTSAASVFLFPGQEKSAQMRAATTNIDGEAHVVVRCMAHASLAGVPFEIVFPLPLGWSVPAPESKTGGESPVAAAQKAAGHAADVKGDPNADKKGGVGLAGGSVGFDVGITKKDE
jgi:type VI secretion system protein ImpC